MSPSFAAEVRHHQLLLLFCPTSQSLRKWAMYHPEPAFLLCMGLFSSFLQRGGPAPRIDSAVPLIHNGLNIHKKRTTPMADALIIDACRTPRGVGKAGKGALSGIHPQQLGATVLRARADRTDIDTADVDDIVWGCSAQVATQGGDLGRMSALDAGYDVRASAVTLDRFCGSGITSVNMAAASIMAGAEDLVIAGGCEMMSMEGRRGGGPMMMDSGNLRLRARHPQS